MLKGECEIRNSHVCPWECKNFGNLSDNIYENFLNAQSLSQQSHFSVTLLQAWKAVYLRMLFTSVGNYEYIMGHPFKEH